VGRPATEIPEPILSAAITDWRAGVLTKAEISRRYEIPIETLRRRLNGIPQDGISTTRAMVAGSMAGLKNPEVDAKVASTVAIGTALAIDAMVTADEVFRLGLKAAKTALEPGGLSSKELRDYISAAKDAMEGVRRVRELDGPTEKEIPKIEIEFIRGRSV
jgi:hypothetical protein